MWYACTGARRSIGLATSKDGVHWTKHPGNPVLEPTEAWEDGYLSPTSVLQVNGKFYLYYWGPSHVFPDRVTGKLPRPKMKYIGLATSDDGIHWTRQGAVDGRPGAVLGPEPPGINEIRAFFKHCNVSAQFPPGSNNAERQGRFTRPAARG